MNSTLDPETRARLIEFSRQQAREFFLDEREKAERSSTSISKGKAPRAVKLRATKHVGRKSGAKTTDVRPAKVAV